MDSKLLKLNEDKTECLIVGPKNRIRNFQQGNKIRINNCDITITDHARNLGVIFDKNLTMTKHINNIVKLINLNLRNVAFIKKYLDKKTITMLIINYIVSRLDYCNSLYINLQKKELKKLQYAQNRAARLIMEIGPRERITPSLIQLHWLPIKARIEFKICVLTYQAVNTGKPAYLKNELHEYNTNLTINTRLSNEEGRFKIPRVNTSYGSRTFKYNAPRLYNDLPLAMRQSENVEIFKKKLKTYLFKKAYNTSTCTMTEDYIV